MASEASKEYQSSLDELTFNSKLHINVLTMLAEENINYAENIVQVIENHIQQASPEKKLPTLYLMDSIMKNLRNSAYPTQFAHNIVSTFVAVFEKVDEKKRQSLYKLRQTWTDIFSNSKLYAVDMRVHQIDPAWPVTARPPDTAVSSIHVNPKFLNQDDDKREMPGPSMAAVNTNSGQIMQKAEEEQLRVELIEEECKRVEEKKMKEKQLDLERRLREEEQEKKMREELLAKQQELMRLQQLRLEMELETTRKALLEKEKLLNERSNDQHKQPAQEKRQQQKKEDEDRQRAEREMRKNIEAEFRRKAEEEAKRKAEVEKKRRAEEEQRRKAQEDQRRAARDPRMKSSFGKGGASSSRSSTAGYQGKPSASTLKKVQSPGKKIIRKKEPTPSSPSNVKKTPPDTREPKEKRELANVKRTPPDTHEPKEKREQANVKRTPPDTQEPKEKREQANVKKTPPDTQEPKEKREQARTKSKSRSNSREKDLREEASGIKDIVDELLGSNKEKDSSRVNTPTTELVGKDKDSQTGTCTYPNQEDDFDVAKKQIESRDHNLGNRDQSRNNSPFQMDNVDDHTNESSDNSKQHEERNVFSKFATPLRKSEEKDSGTTNTLKDVQTTNIEGIFPDKEVRPESSLYSKTEDPTITSKSMPKDEQKNTEQIVLEFSEKSNLQPHSIDTYSRDRKQNLREREFRDSRDREVTHSRERNTRSSSRRGDEKEWERDFPLPRTRASSRQKAKDRDSPRSRSSRGSNSPPLLLREGSRSSKHRDRESDRDRRHTRNYRGHRRSKSPSSEEEEEMLALRPKRFSPTRMTRSATRRSRGSTTPERLIPRKVKREDDERDETNQGRYRDDFEKSGQTKRTVEDKQSDEDLHRSEPPAKKTKEDGSGSQKLLSEDIADLFGTEDIDYRHMAVQPNSGPVRRTLLQNQADFSSPQQKGWAKFKENRPQEFPFVQPRRMSIDVNSPAVKQLSMSPNETSPHFQRSDSSPIINMGDLENILRQADNQVLKGKMSIQQYQELQKQLRELQRIQTMMAEMKNLKELQLAAADKNRTDVGTRIPIMQPPPIPMALIEQKEKKPILKMYQDSSTKPTLLDSPPKQALLETPKPGLLNTPNQSPYENSPCERKTLLETPDRPALLESPRKGLLGDRPRDSPTPSRTTQMTFQEEPDAVLSNRPKQQIGLDALKSKVLESSVHTEQKKPLLTPPPIPPQSLLKASSVSSQQKLNEKHEVNPSKNDKTVTSAKLSNAEKQDADFVAMDYSSLSNAEKQDADFVAMDYSSLSNAEKQDADFVAMDYSSLSNAEKQDADFVAMDYSSLPTEFSSKKFERIRDDQQTQLKSIPARIPQHRKAAEQFNDHEDILHSGFPTNKFERNYDDQKTQDSKPTQARVPQHRKAAEQFNDHEDTLPSRFAKLNKFERNHEDQKMHDSKPTLARRHQHRKPAEQFNDHEDMDVDRCDDRSFRHHEDRGSRKDRAHSDNRLRSESEYKRSSQQKFDAHDRFIPENTERFRKNSTESQIAPLYDADKFYVPEYDPRWLARANRYREHILLNSYEFVIDGKKRYPLMIGDKPKLIFIGDKRRYVQIDKKTREVLIDGKNYTYVGQPERGVILGGKKYFIQVQGMLKRFWIDGHQFELRLDDPPLPVTIAGKDHVLQLDTESSSVVLDRTNLCPIELTVPKTVIIDGKNHILQFTPPARKILLGDKLCELNLSKKFPSVMVDGEEHGIRFEGVSREMVINGEQYVVPMDNTNVIKFGSGKPYAFAFGGPGHEVIIDDLIYQVNFNGPPVTLQIGQRKFEVQLPGNPPKPLILGIVKTPKDISASVIANKENDSLKVQRFREYRSIDIESKVRDTVPQPPPRMESSARGVPSLFDLPIRPTSSYLVPQEKDMPHPHPPMNMNYPRGPPRPPPFGPRGPPIDSLRMPHQRMPFVPRPPVATNPAPPMVLPNLDVGDLFSKLVSAGIINRRKSAERSDSPMPAPSVYRDSPVQQPVSGNAAIPHTVEKAKEENVAPVLNTEKKKEKTPRVPEKKEEVIPDLTDLSSDKLKKKYNVVVQKLYIGIQCNSCGARFKDQSEKYKEHLDWHFRQNKREKEDSRVVRNRRWYYSITDWVQFEEIGELEDRFVSNYFENMLQSIHNVIGGSDVPSDSIENTAETCPIASTNDEENVCVICKDPFEQFYDDDEEEWHLRDAIRIESKTYHPVCYEDAKNEDGNNSSLLETPEAEAPNKLPDPISNPLAYLTALSEQAKQSNQSIDTVAKLHVKNEPMETDSSSSSALKQVASEPSLSTLLNIVNVPAAKIKTEVEESTENVKSTSSLLNIVNVPAAKIKTEVEESTESVTENVKSTSSTVIKVESKVDDVVVEKASTINMVTSVPETVDTKIVIKNDPRTAVKTEVNKTSESENVKQVVEESKEGTQQEGKESKVVSESDTVKPEVKESKEDKKQEVKESKEDSESDTVKQEVKESRGDTNSSDTIVKETCNPEGIGGEVLLEESIKSEIEVKTEETTDKPAS